MKAFCKNSESNAIPPLLELLGKPFVEKYLQDVTVSVHEQVNCRENNKDMKGARKKGVKFVRCTMGDRT